jgi:hypothetical protein
MRSCWSCLSSLSRRLSRSNSWNIPFRGICKNPDIVDNGAGTQLVGNGAGTAQAAVSQDVCGGVPAPGASVGLPAPKNVRAVRVLP